MVILKDQFIVTVLTRIVIHSHFPFIWLKIQKTKCPSRINIYQISVCNLYLTTLCMKWQVGHTSTRTIPLNKLVLLLY